MSDASSRQNKSRPAIVAMIAGSAAHIYHRLCNVGAMLWAQIHASKAVTPSQANSDAAALAQASSYRFTPIGLDRFSGDHVFIRAWERLEAAASLPTQSHMFSAALSGTFLPQAHIQVFAILDATGIGALIPLCREEGYFARWRMMGASEVFEPADALCDGPETARLLAEALARQSRPLWFGRVPANSLLVPALMSAMKGKGWVSLRSAVPCPTITLGDRWKSPDTCFNAGRRSDFRRAARRASEFGWVSFEMHAPDPSEFDALFDEAIGVELCSWKKAAGSAIAVDRSKENFFRCFFRSAAERGIFRVAFMRIDGQAVAMQMAVEWSDRYWLFKIGHDEKFSKCSPGTLLMLHTLGWAASSGLRAYELLGNVEPWIADFWTREQHECVQLRTYPFSAGGAIAFAADTAVWLRKRLTRGSK